MYSPERGHDKNRKMMVEKPIYEQVATALVQYCQCVEGKTGLYQCAYLPEIFCELGFASESAGGYISPNEARMEVRDSINPYGYWFKKSMYDPNIWELCYFSEDSGTIKLCTVSSNNIKPVSKESIIERGEDYFDKHIQSNPSEVFGYYNKILFLIDILAYQKALHASDDAIKTLNNDRWLRMTIAFLMSETDKREAVVEFCEWAKLNKSFLNFVYLYYFAQSVGEKDLALSSIRMAIEQPLIAGDGYNIYYYGSLMTKYAYEHNDSELALKVCDAMTDPLCEKGNILAN